LSTAIPAVTQTGQPILILKEGSTQTRGKDAQRTNILAARLIAEIVKTSLGPRGMDKMLVDSLGDVTVTNDGAVMLKEMDVQHPAAKAMVEISKSTDNEVGDGTTSVVVLAGALLEKGEELLNKEVHPTVIIDGYNKARLKALEILKELSIKVDPRDRTWLKKVAISAMASKLAAPYASYLADIVIDALSQVAEFEDDKVRVDIDDVKVEKKAGGSVSDTKLTHGIILDKEVVHGGMPKIVRNAKIALLNAPLEIEKTEFDAKININNPEQIHMFLEEENRLLKSMVDRIAATGATVVICQKGIDDIAKHYLAKARILAVRRVKQSDIDKLAKATGGRVVTNLQDLSVEDLGYAELVEERKVEEDKWVFVEGCRNPKAVTILVRGGSQRIVEEVERSVHDAICVVRDLMVSPYVVFGAGAIEAEIAYRLESWASTLTGREQLAARKFAEALETIPLILAENSGMDTIDVQVELKARHSRGEYTIGIDALNARIDDARKINVYEPMLVKEHVINSATEATSMILRIDDIIAAGKLKEPKRPGEEREVPSPEE